MYYLVDPAISEVVAIIEDEGSQKVYLHVLGKSKNISGSSALKVAKFVAKEYIGADKLYLFDAALSLKCKFEGHWCHDRAMIRLRPFGALLYGQSYYENHGAKPIGKQPHG